MIIIIIINTINSREELPTVFDHPCTIIIIINNNFYVPCVRFHDNNNNNNNSVSSRFWNYNLMLH